MSISPKSEAKRLQRFICLKYYIINAETRKLIQFELDAANIPDYIRKNGLNKSC